MRDERDARSRRRLRALGCFEAARDAWRAASRGPAPLEGVQMSGKSCTMLSIVLAGAIGAPPLAGQSTLVVLDSHDAQAILVDPATRTVVARLPTGPDPREVAISPDGRFAYVTSYEWETVAERPELERAARRGLARGPRIEQGAAAAQWEAARLARPPRGPGRSPPLVTVLDLANRRVHAVFRPGPYRRVHGIRVGRDGARLWMTAEADSGVVELDARTGEVLMLWKTGGAKSHTLAVSPDNRRIYVANSGSDSITVIDRVTVVPRRVPAGRGPEGLALTADGSELWVTNRADHTVTILKTSGMREIATFPSGGAEPVRIRFTPDGNEAWVTNRRGRTVSVFDVASAALLETVAVEGEPRSLAFSPEGSLAFVTLPAEGRVSVIEVATRRVVGSVPTGGGPHGVASGAGRGGSTDAGGR